MGVDDFKKKHGENILRFPIERARPSSLINQQGGIDQSGDEDSFKEVATTLKLELEQIIANRPRLGVSNAEVKEKKDSLLREAGYNKNVLEDHLEESLRIRVFQYKTDVVFYMSVALAYLEIIEKEKTM